MSSAKKWRWVARSLFGDGVRRPRGGHRQAAAGGGRYHFEFLEDRAMMSAAAPLAGPWQPSPAAMAPDAYENDNSFAQAKAITVNGTAQSHSINMRGDVDYVKFTLTAATDVVLATSGSSGDTELSLYNASRRLVAYNDDTNGTFSKIATTLAAGTYYARVNEYGNNATIASYALAVTGSATGGGTTPTTTTSYMLYTSWGGTYSDADKSTTNTDDDLMCWAATTSNMLQWTGWGDDSGLTTADAIFSYFQSHWSDQGGHQYYGIDWWFDGTNDVQGASGWSQVEVPGGGFFTAIDVDDYIHYSGNTSTAATTVASYLRSGYAVGLGLAGAGGHAVTCWGYEYATGNTSSIKGIYITDSDDNQSSPNSDSLKYYEVASSRGRWYLQDYYGSDSWYISDVTGLESQTSTTASAAASTVASAYTGPAHFAFRNLRDATGLADTATGSEDDLAVAQLAEDVVVTAVAVEDTASPTALAPADLVFPAADEDTAAAPEQASRAIALLKDVSPLLRVLASRAVFETYE